MKKMKSGNITLSKNMNFRTWLDMIDDHGSSNDPIWFKDEEMTPCHLATSFSDLDPIAGIKFWFYTKPGHLKFGTAYAMLKDRILP